jgi:hypothetical protein
MMIKIGADKILINHEKLKNLCAIHHGLQIPRKIDLFPHKRMLFSIGKTPAFYY